MQITFDSWVDHYKPTGGGSSAPGIDDQLFGYETFGSDLRKVSETPNDYVWTVIESDDGEDLLIVPGTHFVNRIAYCITEVPWKDDELEVVYD